MEYINKQSPEQRRGGYFSNEPREFLVSFTPHRTGTYRIEIDNEIESVSQFATAIQVLENAKEEDEVIIYLQCNGGSVNAGEAFVHAMRKCEAPIHIVATGGVHSMGSHILLEADSFELSAGFNSLIHCGQDGAYGNVNEYHAKSKFDMNFRATQFKDAYQGFLSEQEIEDVLSGKDLWLDGDGWLVRAEARHEFYKAKMQAMIDAEEAEIEAEVEAAMKASTSKPARKPRVKKALDTVK